MNSGGRLGEAIKSYKSLWQTTFRTKSVIRAWLKVLLLIKLFYVKFNLFEEDCLFRVTCFGFFVVCLSNVSTWRISRLQDYKIFQQSLESWDKLKPAAVICYSFCHPSSGPQEWWMLLKEKRNSIYSCLTDSQCWVEDSFHNLGEWKGPSAVLLIRENKVHFMKDCLKVAIETTFYWVINYRDFKRLLLWAFYSFLIESLLSGLVCTDLVVKRQSSSWEWVLFSGINGIKYDCEDVKWYKEELLLQISAPVLQ